MITQLGIFVNVKIVNLLNCFLTHFSLKVQKKFKKFWRKTRKIESAYIVELIAFQNEPKKERSLAMSQNLT